MTHTHTHTTLNDLRNRVFGKWVVLARGPDRITSWSFHVRWWCRCMGCRSEYLVFGSNLVQGLTTQCNECRCRRAVP